MATCAFEEFRLMKRIAQHNRYAKIWVVVAVVFLAGASFLASKIHHFQSMRKDRRKLSAYIVLVGLLSLLHIFLLFATPYIRRCAFVRRRPNPFVVAFTCTVTALIPLACTIDGSLSDESSDINSLGAILCFSADFFCLQMAIMPTHDYMVPHTALFLAATVVYAMARQSRLQILWLGLTAFGTVLLLTLHHWLTAPMTVRDSRRVVIDARVVVGLPVLPEDSRDLVRTALSDEWISATVKVVCLLFVVIPAISIVVLMSYSSE